MRASSIAESIDRLFANASDETTTLDEKEWVSSRIEQIGDVRFFVYSILGAVLFTLLFLSGTTIMQSMRERVPEFGVLKSLGFTDTSVSLMVVLESLVLCVAGPCSAWGSPPRYSRRSFCSSE